MTAKLKLLLTYYVYTTIRLDKAKSMEFGSERDKKVRYLTKEIWRIVVRLDSINILLDRKFRKSIRDVPLPRSD